MISRLKRIFIVRLFLQVKMTTETPQTNMASVDSMKGAPRIGPDTHLIACVSSREQDGDEGDYRLGKSGADRRQHAADSTLTQMELPPEPLDAVARTARSRRG